LADKLSSESPEIAAAAVITDSCRKKSRREELEFDFILRI